MERTKAVLKKLKKQALLESAAYYGLDVNSFKDSLPEVRNQVDARFAELIIEETLGVARAGIEYGPSMEEAVYRYFGIKK